MVIRLLLYCETRSSALDRLCECMMLLMPEEKLLGLISLMLRKEIDHGGLVMERVRLTLNERRKQSVIGSSAVAQLEGVRPIN